MQLPKALGESNESAMPSDDSTRPIRRGGVGAVAALAARKTNHGRLGNPRTFAEGFSPRRKIQVFAAADRRR